MLTFLQDYRPNFCSGYEQFCYSDVHKPLCYPPNSYFYNKFIYISDLYSSF